MSWFQLIVLAILQGLTEFLPISSSAHLILVPQLTDWPDQGLAFDVAVHVGTLAAVLVYFREEVSAVLFAVLRSIGGRGTDRNATLGWWIAAATIPAGIFGLLFSGQIETYLRSPMVIAITTIVFGLVLWWADAMARCERDEYATGWRRALLIGFAQALALIPGTSRSGITITAGLALGLTRQAAARFSFLLSIPIIVLAGSKQMIEVLETGSSIPLTQLAAAAVISGITAWIGIRFFLALLDRVGMLPFVIYRLILGVVLLLVLV